VNKVSLIIPCLNEEEGIEKVLIDVGKVNLNNEFILLPLVIDNNSSDNTADLARRLGAQVITENRQGKGYAVKKGFSALPKDANYVVMIDGDSTYQIKEIGLLLKDLFSGVADVVVGDRLHGKIEKEHYQEEIFL